MLAPIETYDCVVDLTANAHRSCCKLVFELCYEDRAVLEVYCDRI